MGDSESTTASEMEKLWQQLWTEILLRIKAKDLGICLSVCKTWYYLILSPQFITSHTKFHQTHLTFILRNFTKPSPTVKGQESYHLFSDSEQISENLNKGFLLPFKTHVGLNFRVVGCVNGVVCIADSHFGNTYTYILWNPLVKKHVKLPKPRIVFDVVGPYMHVLGFGYDYRTDDLKVVRVSYIQDVSGLDEIPPKAEVFSVKSGVWKWVLSDDVSTCVVEEKWSQCFLNGCVHWLGFDRNDEVDSSFKSNCLLVFGVEEERFRKMELPVALLEVCPLVLEVFQCKGLLAVKRYGRVGDSFEMWIQKEYDVVESWSKVLSVDLKGMNLQKCLRWRQNGDLLAHMKEGDLVCYNPNTENMISLRNDGCFGAYEACSFTESLVFLEKDSENRRTVLLEEDSTVAIDSNEDETPSLLDAMRVCMGREFVLLYQMMKFRREF